MEENQDAYLKTVRSVKGKVEFGFYQNSSDDTADLSIIPEYSQGNWREKVENQIVSVGLKPSHKFIGLNTANNLDGNHYLYNGSLNTVIPSWSTVVCNQNGTFTTNPQFVLDYNSFRLIEFIKIVGDEMLMQAPLKYKIYLYTDKSASLESSTDELVDDGAYCINMATPTTYDDSGTYRVYVFSVDVSAQSIDSVVKQTIKFSNKFKTIKAVVEIEQWSEPNTTAKIMNLTNDMKVLFDNSKISSINVLEEKCSEVNKLSYGITSNTCQVSVSNQDGRFTKNIDLLKKNRIVIPKLICDDNEVQMGKFFAEDWEVSSTSHYVKCKAYDVLYNLQNMYIYYEMSLQDGIYVMDANMSVYNVFKKIFTLVNLEKKANGIFGDDIQYNIDARLSSINMELVNLGYDTAWNMLKYLANYAQCFIYVDRTGVIQVVRDELGTDRLETHNKLSSSITPSNSFTYNLPTMSKAVVNRVIIPYQVEEVGETSDSQFKITDFTTDDTGNVVVVLECKNFHKDITSIERCSDENFKSVIEFNGVINKISPNRIDITFNADRNKVYDDENKEVIYLKIYSSNCVKLVEKELVINDTQSQKMNGVSEFKLEPNKLVLSSQVAQSMAYQIISEYADGKGYIETKWRGTPNLLLGYYVDSNAKNSDTYTYECVSNEFNLSNGLSVVTKARQQKSTT